MIYDNRNFYLLSLHGNCYHCHNGNREFDFNLNDFKTNIDRSSPRLIHPIISLDSLEESAIYNVVHGMEMPPLGVQLRDDNFLEELTLYLEELQSE